MDEARKNNAIKDIQEHLSQVDEVALIVLKGHLLIEESLGRIISNFVFHEDKIDSARLSFYQKVWIGRSMSLREQDNSMWDLIVAINALRNDLAHSLNSPKRQNKIDRVLSLYEAETVDMEDGPKLSEFDEAHIKIAFAISLCTGFLSTFEAEVERFKAVVGTLDRLMNTR